MGREGCFDRFLREIVTEMSDAGMASFEEDGDVVTITYKLVKVSNLDNVSRDHQDWPDTTDLICSLNHPECGDLEVL